MQLFATGHARTIQDFAEDAGGCQAGQPGQIHRGLGMPGATEYTPLLGHQGKQVAGTDQVLGLGRRVDDRLDRPSTLAGADPRSAGDVVHRNRVRCLMRGRVAVDHRPEMESSGDLGQDWHAQEPASMRDHELDHLGRDHLGRRDKISLVFPVFVIHDDDDPPFLQGLERVVDSREFIVHRRFLT